jgi:hypothetical protein
MARSEKTIEKKAEVRERGEIEGGKRVEES